MAVPVIDPQSSVPGGLRVGTPFEFQLALTEDSDAATSWSVVGPLPPGFDFDTDTGLLSGTPTVSLVRSIQFKATNGSGTSTPVTVAFGVEDIRIGTQGMAELFFDLDTLQVWNPVEPTSFAPLKGVQGDKKLVSIGLVKNGELQDKVVSAIKVRMLNDEDSTPFLLTSGGFEKIGGGISTRYVVQLDFTVAGVAQMIADWDDPRSKGGYPFVQIEFTLLTPPPGSSSPTLQPMTSLTFPAYLQAEI
jgi:hypothetical protein